MDIKALCFYLMVEMMPFHKFTEMTPEWLFESQIMLTSLVTVSTGIFKSIGRNENLYIYMNTYIYK